MNGYHLIDSGSERKLEAFGLYQLIRPCPQAVWTPKFPLKWETFHGEFVREGSHDWKKREIPPSWDVTLEKLIFRLKATDFGHLGIFPEHAMHWEWMQNKIVPQKSRVLNLFAYSGGATMALAKEGALVCHLDASKKMVEWARENARLNGLEQAPIRWIVDDAIKFLKREIKRKASYQGILLDPPSFGRGSQGQVFKIERDIFLLLNLCNRLLSQKGFMLLTSHTPGFTPNVLKNLLMQMRDQGNIEVGEMVIPSLSFPLPSGSYARWYG